MEATHNPYSVSNFRLASDASVDDRAAFIAKTYAHLVGAVGLLVVLETALVQSSIGPRLIELMVGNRFSWLIVLGAFMGTSWLANSWAMSTTSLAKQYAGLFLYTVAQAVILLPLVYFALLQDPTLVTTAATVTLALFLALTAVVWVTRRDFSFLRPALMFGGIAALVIIVLAVLFDFQLGNFFCAAMIAFACGYILYDTSNVLHRYHIGQHVAAALALFASVALLFWYVLRLVQSNNR